MITMTERWKALKSMPKYEVSNTGKIRMVWRKTPISLSKDSNGHLVFNVNIDGVQGSRRVARAVGEAFCPSYKPHLRPIYRDGDKTNCIPSNLKWVPQSKVTGHPYSRNPKP